MDLNFLLSRRVKALLLVMLWCDSPGADAQSSEFEHWKAAQQQQFRDYQTSEDRAFIAFLEKEWQEFQIFTGAVRDITPKPAVPPRVSNSFQAAAVATAVVSRQPVAPEQLQGLFYGHNLRPPMLPGLALPNLDSPANDPVADTWAQLSASDHSSVVTSLQSLISEMRLGDWGVVKLVEHLIARTDYNTNQKTAYTWFLLNRLGYDVRVGYTNAALYLLIPSDNMIYARNYSTIGQRSYFIYPQPPQLKIWSYDGSYEDGMASVDVRPTRLIEPSGQVGRIEIEMPREIGGYQLRLAYDSGVVHYLEDYPQLELPLYFDASALDPAASSLLSQLAPMLEGKSEREAVNFLLAFTQRLFAYQTDQQQFGAEKYLFIEQSLHHGSNDCEDRSIFLAWLLRNLLNTEVLVLDYPGHVALAVGVAIQPNDNMVHYLGRKFVIADPTYIGATLGMAMTSLEGVAPDIKPVASTQPSASSSASKEGPGNL